MGGQAPATLPLFRPDGYLPEGIHGCTEAEATFRFGSATKQRQRLVTRVRRWIDLARLVGARRLVIDGSFVTSKKQPQDVDAVMLIPVDFQVRVSNGDAAALELEQMFLTRQPEEIFAAEDDADWQAWCEFFSRTREPDARRKGIVEIIL